MAKFDRLHFFPVGPAFPWGARGKLLPCFPGSLSDLDFRDLLEPMGRDFTGFLHKLLHLCHET